MHLKRWRLTWVSFLGFMCLFFRGNLFDMTSCRWWVFCTIWPINVWGMGEAHTSILYDGKDVCT